MAKIHLCARFSRHEEMSACRDVLTALGHQVISRWIDDYNDRSAVVSPEMLNRKNRSSVDTRAIDRIVGGDLQDIRDADWIICFSVDWYKSIAGLGPPTGDDHSDGLQSRHVELGYALALNKRVIVCGKREHQYHAAEGVEVFPTWDELLISLIGQVRRTESEVGS